MMTTIKKLDESEIKKAILYWIKINDQIEIPENAEVVLSYEHPSHVDATVEIVGVN